MEHISKDLEVLKSSITAYLEERRAQRQAEAIADKAVLIMVSVILGFVIGHLLAYITM